MADEEGAGSASEAGVFVMQRSVASAAGAV